MTRKLYIIDLKKDYYDIKIHNCDVIYTNIGHVSLINSKKISLDNIIIKYDIKKKFINIINKKLYDHKNFFLKELEIFNLRNDKNIGISKILNFLGIYFFLKKNKKYKLNYISDDSTTINLLNGLTKKKINNHFNGKISNPNLRNNFIIYYVKFFFKIFFILIFLKLFNQDRLKKKLKEKEHLWCLSLYPNFYNSKNEYFFGKKYKKINFLVTDETHLNLSFFQILKIYFSNKNNILNIESFINIKDLFQIFFKVYLIKKKLSKLLEKKFVINGLDFSDYYRELLSNSFINRLKLSSYDQAIRRFYLFFNPKKFNTYLFEYNFGFYLIRKFKELGCKIIGYQHGIFNKNLMWLDLITKNNEKVYFPDIIVSNHLKSLEIYKNKYKSNNIKYFYSKKKISRLATQIKIKPTIKEKNILIIPGTHDIKDIYSYCKLNLRKSKKNNFFIKLHPKNQFFFEDEKRIKKIKDISQKNFKKVIVSSTSTISYDLHLLNKKFDVFKPDYKSA